ncbi:MerR family transcriptional regulator [Streptomyces marincola]|nr:MerR family transcriptional regulator [Streptomyces marincola]
MRHPVVGIGEAAALYDIAPSTLRWWERQGVLPPPERVRGRRAYPDAELRRIGLAYLCCVTGAMPLAHAARVASGRERNTAWQATVREQITRLDEQAARLTAARRYLEHLLGCPDDDPVARCPVLDQDLAAHTPRGRVPEADLTAAARAARARGTAALRDENPERGPERDVTGARAGAVPCAGCGRAVARAPRGRPRTHCSPACRQRAYRARTARQRQGAGAGEHPGPAGR